MVLALFSSRARLAALRDVVRHVAEHIDLPISARLWDGSVLPLGRQARPDVCLAVRGPGVISSLLRRPTLDNLFRHYATGGLDIEGADLQTFAELARSRNTRQRQRGISKLWCAWKLWPFVFGRADRVQVAYRFADEAGIGQTAGRNNKDFVRFHYDVSNRFYELFLGKQMQYTCNYFTDWDNNTDQAETDKMEVVCRKLRLRPGDRVLELGCGWGGLACYMATNYGVTVRAYNLSVQQVEYAREKARRLGLEDRVRFECKDAIEAEGTYDKVVSIGMFEHIGIDNYPTYLKKVNSVLEDRGLALVHMICRGAKPAGVDFRRARPEHRLLRRYIFPGGELGNVGDLVQAFEGCRFEVHDVEGWRDHYARTLKLWSHALAANEEEAVREVGYERYRLWLAYLTGMGMGFADGTLRLFQVLGTKHKAKGPSRMPNTRADLYARAWPSEAMRQAEWAGGAFVGPALPAGAGCD